MGVCDAVKPIYLDYAAATPLDNDVLDAMKPYFNEQFYNPSATYVAARDVKREIEHARSIVAGWLGAPAADIVFTAGGTEANNLAVRGVMEAFPGAHMIVSAIEHESVLRPASLYSHTLVPVTPGGVLKLDALAKRIKDNTVLISVMYANNEIGTIQPLKDVTSLIKNERQKRLAQGNDTPLYLHTDACQAANYLDMHVSRLGVDMMTINGGKIYGPKQSGALYISRDVRVNPQILGGGQENGRRSGTENVPAIIGLAVALDKAQSMRKEESARLAKLQGDFIKNLSNALPQTIVNGSLKHRLPNNVHVTIPDTDNETIMMRLDERGIQCAVGSACSASSEEPSHVLMALGMDEDAMRASLRFTLGRETTVADVSKTVRALAAVTG